MRSRIHPTAVPAVLTAVALAASGCGTERTAEESKPVTERAAAAPAAGTDGQISTNLAVEPQIPKPSGALPTTLTRRDIVVGKGEAAKTGDTVSMQYVGVSASTGQVFDASWSRGRQPFSFPLGQGQVIAGWDEGIVGMKPGGRRELIIPPDKGYGAAGSPPAIAANETLIFVVDLEKVS